MQSMEGLTETVSDNSNLIGVNFRVFGGCLDGCINALNEQINVISIGIQHAKKFTEGLTDERGRCGLESIVNTRHKHAILPYSCRQSSYVLLVMSTSAIMGPYTSAARPTNPISDSI